VQVLLVHLLHGDKPIGTTTIMLSFSVLGGVPNMGKFPLGEFQDFRGIGIKTGRLS